MTFTKIDPADLDSPRRELSNGGLKSVVALLVRREIIFLSARIGRSIQLYSFYFDSSRSSLFDVFIKNERLGMAVQ